MTVPVVVYDVTYRARSVEVPERCPECGADLRKSDAVVASASVDGWASWSVTVAAGANDLPNVVGMGLQAEGEIYVHGLMCAKCDHMLAVGERTFTTGEPCPD